MRHLRSDYDAIQPWPTKRPHIGKVTPKTETERFELDPLPFEPSPIIPDDEPVFLLRSSDTIAPGIVRAWAIALHKAQGRRVIVYRHMGAPPVCEDPSPLVARALAWADEMEAYAKTNYDGGHVPDVPDGALL